MRPGPPSTADHGDTAMYRRGCRCPQCREAHAAEKRQYVLENLYGVGAPMGPETRSQVIRLLKTGLSVAQAAQELGVTHQRIYGACKALPDFGEQVDELTRIADEKRA